METPDWMPNAIFCSFKAGERRKKVLERFPFAEFPLACICTGLYQKGLFCKYCPLFVTGASGGSNRQVPLLKLVIKPVTKFAKLLGKDEDLTVHDTSQYHHDAIEAEKSFLRAYHSPQMAA